MFLIVYFGMVNAYVYGMMQPLELTKFVLNERVYYVAYYLHEGKRSREAIRTTNPLEFISFVAKELAKAPR